MNVQKYILASALFLFAFGSQVQALPLAEGGKALQPIIISGKASPGTKAVAQELAQYLGQIAGCPFVVETGNGMRGIVLGTLEEFPDSELKVALKIRNTYDGREAFAIRTEPARIRLMGATDLGTSHAAFALLEHLGCRWFFPAKEWEVVPRIPNLQINYNVTDRPKVLARRIWYGYGSFNGKGHPRGGTCQGDYDSWSRHNRMASSFKVYTGHAWQSIILSNKKTFDQHPEFLALVKGKRQGEQMCVSNPAVRELAVKWALDFFVKNPDREMVSMDCSDGDGQCECENCQKLGSISNRVFGLTNEAAKKVAEKYPGKMVGCLAYSQHSEPPDFPLEPNVYIQLTAGFIRGQYSFEELAELWPKKCKNMGFYEYYSVWLWDFDKLPGGNGANLKRIQDGIQKYVRLGATSIDAESGNNWGIHGLGYYVSNKLMWNPHANVDSLVSDFFDKGFGPASKSVRRYYERWAPDREPLISRGLVGELFRDLEEASQLAKDRPDVLARLDHLKHYLRYTHLRWLLDHEKDKMKQKQQYIDILTLAYRTRYEYMNHWNAMQTSFAGDGAKKFGEDGWKRNAKEPKPWTVDRPVTKEETEQWFREGLDYFQPTPVVEKKYDLNDLVPIGFPSGKPASLVRQFQRPERFAVTSLKGEPIEIELLAGIIAWYRDRPDARWTLKDSQGKTVAKGEKKLDGEAFPLQIKVPSSGTYFFECNDSAAGWRIKGSEKQSISWLPQRGRRVIPLGQMQELFFYVPKETKDLQFFYSGTPCKILGPDRKVLAEVKGEDEVITIRVPDGKDGQVWSISPHSHSFLWMMNAPNSFAASPIGLLIPRALAEKDQLFQKK